jgi:hypothetical protein
LRGRELAKLDEQTLGPIRDLGDQRLILTAQHAPGFADGFAASGEGLAAPSEGRPQGGLEVA